MALSAVVAGLNAFEPVKGRSQVRPLRREGRALTLVDDTYNANPDSVRAAIEVLAALPAPRWLVLGDMGEVGDQGPGSSTPRWAPWRASRGIEQVWCVGSLARHAAQAGGHGARHFNDMASLLAHLGEAAAFESVLVKGSRFMKMEQVVAALQAAGTEGASCC